MSDLTGPPSRDLEQEFREREIRVKEREQDTREADLALRSRELSKAGWRSPLVVAVFAAALGAFGNAAVAYINGVLQRELETQRGEQARLLEVIKTGSPDKAAENIRFLLDAGLINDPPQAEKLRAFLATRKPGSGPALPAPAGSSGRDEGPDVSIPANALADGGVKTAARAVGQLMAGGSAICSAFLVEPRVIMTAGYCVKVLQAPFSFRIGEQVFQVQDAPLELDTSQDYGHALMRLDRDVQGIAPLQLSANPTAVGTVLAIVFFRGSNQQLAIASTAGCSVSRVDAASFSYGCQSGQGSAGAPVLSADGKLVLGVHVAGNSGTGIANRGDRIAATSGYLTANNRR